MNFSKMFSKNVYKILEEGIKCEMEVFFIIKVLLIVKDWIKTSFTIKNESNMLSFKSACSLVEFLESELKYTWR